jgi:hypothetical protein
MNLQGKRGTSFSARPPTPSARPPTPFAKEKKTVVPPLACAPRPPSTRPRPPAPSASCAPPAPSARPHPPAPSASCAPPAPSTGSERTSGAAVVSGLRRAHRGRRASTRFAAHSLPVPSFLLRPSHPFLPTAPFPSLPSYCAKCMPFVFGSESLTMYADLSGFILAGFCLV